MNTPLDVRISSIYKCVEGFDAALNKLYTTPGVEISLETKRQSFAEFVGDVIDHLAVMSEDEYQKTAVVNAAAIAAEIAEGPYKLELHNQIKQWLIDNSHLKLSEETAMKTKLEQMIEAIRNNNGCVIDDHNNSKKDLPVYAVSIFTRGSSHIVMHYEKSPHCINPLYICEEDGLPHLSTRSVGGNVNMHLHANLTDAIFAFNNQKSIIPDFDFGKLTETTLI